MRNWKKVLSVTAAAAVAATAAMPTAVFAEGDGSFKIGVIGPMTGDYAQYGTNVYNAAKIAVDEINQRRRELTDTRSRYLMQAMIWAIRRRR